MTQEDGLVLTLKTRIREVLGSNIGQDTCYLSLGYELLSAYNFQLHNISVILTFGAVYCGYLTAS
jgi:hypothetical protein